MTIFGDGEQVRAFSYIDDVAPVIARGPLVPKARNQAFNVGGDTPYTVNQLVTAVKKAMDVPNHQVESQPARMEVVVAVSNHDKAKEYFQQPPAVLLDDGLHRTVAWYKLKGKFFKPVEFASVEIIAQMPPSWVRSDLKEQTVCEGSRVAEDSDATEHHDTKQQKLDL